MKKLFMVLLTVALACLLTAGPALSAEKVLKLGASVGMTGRLAKEGGYVKDGYTLWMEMVNAKGGIKVGNDNYKVEIVFYDDKSDPQTGAKLTEKLITEDKVKFILGPFGSGITLATSAIGEKYKVLTVACQANARQHLRTRLQVHHFHSPPRHLLFAPGHRPRPEGQSSGQNRRRNLGR